MLLTEGQTNGKLLMRYSFKTANSAHLGLIHSSILSYRVLAAPSDINSLFTSIRVNKFLFS